MKASNQILCDWRISSVWGALRMQFFLFGLNDPISDASFNVLILNGQVETIL